MLDLIKECEDTINTLTEQSENIGTQLDSLDQEMHLGSVSFDLSKDLSLKQKLYMWGLLASRLAGAELSKDDELIEACKADIDRAYEIKTLKTMLNNLREEKHSYIDFLIEARALLTNDEKRNELDAKFKAFKDEE
jgi:hypothetical protein